MPSLASHLGGQLVNYEAWLAAKSLCWPLLLGMQRAVTVAVCLAWGRAGGPKRASVAVRRGREDRQPAVHNCVLFLRLCRRELVGLEEGMDFLQTHAELNQRPTVTLHRYRTWSFMVWSWRVVPCGSDPCL